MTSVNILGVFYWQSPMVRRDTRLGQVIPENILGIYKDKYTDMFVVIHIY